MTTTELKTFAIFTTGDYDKHSDRLEYVTESDDEEGAFEAFANDIFSGDCSVESGWTWHVYEIPSEIADDDDAIYDYVADRSPVVMTS